LVTPTSQIVGTQAVLNVLAGERYKSITKETAGVLRGEYGAAPAAVNTDLQSRVLGEGELPVVCRPADNIKPELAALENELVGLTQTAGFELSEGDRQIDDVLTYALFPQVGLKFLQHRNDPSIFEPVPTGKSPAQLNEKGEEVYTVKVEGKSYTVAVANGGDISAIGEIGVHNAESGAVPDIPGEPVTAPLSGNVVKVLVEPGQVVAEGESVIILEAMKMETSISAPNAGKIVAVKVQSGDSCAVGDTLVTIA
jgi:oxaloacetate decarboxylase alpha subunit